MSQRSNRRSRRKIKVLVVDDDKLALAACLRSLSPEFRVMIAELPDVALDLVRREKPDIAIVDLRLGSMSGIDLIAKLRGLRPRLRIALLTGYASIDVAVAAAHAGAELVIPKPIDYRELMRRFHSTEVPDAVKPPPTLLEIEWDHIRRVLDDCHGNQSLAATLLGVNRSTLHRIIQRRARKR